MIARDDMIFVLGKTNDLCKSGIVSGLPSALTSKGLMRYKQLVDINYAPSKDRIVKAIIGLDLLHYGESDVLATLILNHK